MNTLFYGDNLDSLRRLKDETVDLCYIDPPFNSKRNYNQIYNNVGKEDRAQAQAFVDTWIWDDQATPSLLEITTNDKGLYSAQTIELIRGLCNVLKKGSLMAYLVSMTQRLVEIHRVLKPTGSFYLHCDPTSSHYLKLVLDGIFCSNGGDYRNEIVWKRTSARSDSHRWNQIHDTILFYTKSNEYTWNTQYTTYDEKYVADFYRQNDEDGRSFTSSDLTAAGTRGGESGKPWRGTDPTAKGRHWALPKQMLESLGITSGTTQDRLDKLEKLGRILWPRNEGGVPRYKRYLDEMPGVAIQSVITEIQPLSAKSAEKLGYPTQKPEALLERIIKASSNEKDVVLDAYCGCGTTVAVAQRLNRRWIGMDITFQSISLVLKRLEYAFGAPVADAVRLNGVPKDMASAIALAHKKDDRLRKEFEKWAVLTYTMNRAAINEKKGADAGVDGTAYFLTGPTDTDKMVFQVKSGKVGRGDIAKLNSDRQREDAELATLITLEEPTSPMRSEARSAGVYTHSFTGRNHPRIQIVTVREIIEDRKTFDLPLSIEALKIAPKIRAKAEQRDLGFEKQVG